MADSVFSKDESIALTAQHVLNDNIALALIDKIDGSRTQSHHAGGIREDPAERKSFTSASQAPRIHLPLFRRRHVQAGARNDLHDLA